MAYQYTIVNGEPAVLKSEESLNRFLKLTEKILVRQGIELKVEKQGSVQSLFIDDEELSEKERIFDLEMEIEESELRIAKARQEINRIKNSQKSVANKETIFEV